MFRNDKPVDDIFSDETGYNNSTRSLYSDYLDQLSITLCYSKDLYVIVDGKIVRRDPLFG